MKLKSSFIARSLIVSPLLAVFYLGGLKASGYPCLTCPDVSDSFPTCSDDGPGGNGPNGGNNGGCPSCPRPGVSHGMAQFRVSQPYMSVQIYDTPLIWKPARGRDLDFSLYYRQRGNVTPDPNVFGVGNNWNCSFNAFLIDMSASSSGLLRYHKGGNGWTFGTNGVGTFLNGEIPSDLGGGVYQIAYPDGSLDIFSKVYTNVDGDVCYFITSQKDPMGNATTYTYVNTTDYVQLLSVTDADGGTYSLYYENVGFPMQITKVVSPDTRTNLLQYDSSGYLTNIIDPVGLSSQFVYDDGSRRSWITNMITAYGTNTFVYGGVDAEQTSMFTSGNVVNRYVEVTLPNGGKELYLYRDDCSDILGSSYSPVPTIDVPNTFDNASQNQANSFYWGPRQHDLLTNTVLTLSSNEYRVAYLKHWLYSVGSVPMTLSVERLPSPDWATDGALTWYDYNNKVSGDDHVGDSSRPSIVARVLPDGGTNYQAFTRNAFGTPTERIETYTQTNGSPALRTNSFTFSMDNMDLIQHIGPNGEQVVSNYFNAYHQPLASYDALNQETLFTYNANHQLIKTVRPSGLTTTNIYFASGPSANRLDKTIDLEINRTNAFTYTGCMVYSHTDERGLLTTNYWDKLLRPLGVAYPDGSTSSNIFTALDVTATKDRLGYWTYSSFNRIRQKVAETNANNVITRYGYCTCGSLTAVTNAFGSSVQALTTFGYDNQGNRTAEYLPDDTVLNSYDSLQRLANTSSTLGARQIVYNNQGLLCGITNGMGLEKWTVFDNEDRSARITDINGVTVTNTFDDLGRLRTRTYPDAGVESFGYSARGMITFTNQIGKITYWGYDEAMRKLAETNANSEVIRYTNNAAGDLLSLTDGKTQTTKWNYDEFGRLTNKVDQAGTEILRYKYDADSRLTNRWSIAMGDTKYAYDPVGNLTNIDYPASTDVRFQFDALNRVTNMVDDIGTTVYTYTAGGQLLAEDGPFASDTLTNVYYGRLRTGLGLQQPSGNWTNGFGYNPAAQLTNVTSQAGSFGYELSATASASPLIKKVIFPSGAYISNSFDNVARGLTNRLNNSSHSMLDVYGYIYNPANQRTNLARSDGSYYSFRYDNLGQLTVADSSVGAEDRGYLYDAAWNLNQRTNNGVTSAFVVDPKNQLTNAPVGGGGQQIFDANGNLVTNTFVSFVYDDENRLVTWYYFTAGGSDPSAGALKTDFFYDGLGRLRLRAESHWEGGMRPASRGSLLLNSLLGGDDSWYVDYAVQYIYDGKRVIQERTESDLPVVSYTRGRDLSGTFEGAGGIGGLLARSEYVSTNWTNHACYFADADGNVTYMIDGSQAMVASYRYDPFGNTISKSGTLADDNVYRFSSKEIHVPSGLYYYLYRFYDPNLQRWINRDPIGEKGGINLYEYVGNNPVTEVDLFGLQVTSVPQSPVQWPPINPFPSHPASADKDKGVQNNSGNAPVAYPVPATTMSPCKNQGEVRITKPPTLTGGSCPCSNIPIRCFSYESCEKIPVAQGLNGTMWSLRWVPYTRCTRCPEY